MATTITSDNFDEYFEQALNSKGADALGDDPSAENPGIEEVEASEIDDNWLMLLLNATTGYDAAWKKATLAELVKKIDSALSLVHNATLVVSLPTASAETMGRMYLVPAALQTTALWDWANGVPSGLRDVVISGTDQSGTLPSDNDTYRIGIGPAEAGNTVSCRVVQSSDTFVTIGTGVAINIPVAVAGDVVTMAFADNTAANCTFGGTALSGSTFTHTVTAAEAAAGQITLITTDTVKITSIGAIYLAGNKAQGFDPQHTQCDKYITIADTTSGTTVYRWEQIGSAYINMSGYYTKQETDNILEGMTDNLRRYVDEHSMGVELIETSADTLAILPNKFYKWTSPKNSLELTFAYGYTGVANHYMFEFTCPSDAGTSLTLPSTILWADDDVLEPEPGMTYQVSILNGLAVYAGWEAASE